MRGRKPLPTEMKLLRGNPGGRPLNEDEPQPDTDIPPAPEHFTEDARKEWDRISVELYNLGLLSNIDLAALAIYCTAYGRYAEAERHLKDEGVLKKKDPNDPDCDYHYNQWVGVSNKAIDLMKSMLAEFGLSPSARTRIKAKRREEKERNKFFA